MHEIDQIHIISSSTEQSFVPSFGQYICNAWQFNLNNNKKLMTSSLSPAIMLFDQKCRECKNEAGEHWNQSSFSAFPLSAADCRNHANPNLLRINYGKMVMKLFMCEIILKCACDECIKVRHILKSLHLAMALEDWKSPLLYLSWESNQRPWYYYIGQTQASLVKPMLSSLDCCAECLHHSLGHYAFVETVVRNGVLCHLPQAIRQQEDNRSVKCQSLLPYY